MGWGEGGFEESISLRPPNEKVERSVWKFSGNTQLEL